MSVEQPKSIQEPRESRILFRDILAAIAMAERLFGSGSGQFKLKFVLEHPSLQGCDEDVVRTITEGLLGLDLIQKYIKNAKGCFGCFK